MGQFASFVPAIATIATLCGLWAVAEFTWSSCPMRSCWSRRVVICIFLLLAISCFVAASFWPRGVVPFGIAIGSLFLGALWSHSSQTETPNWENA